MKAIFTFYGLKMKIVPAENPFNAKQLKDLVHSINVNHLVIDDLKKTQKDTDYMSEDILSKTKSTDPKTQIYVWLKRTERYFKNTLHSKNPNDHESATVEFLKSFIQQWLSFPKQLKYFFIVDQEVLNCLIYSLMSCQDKDVWKQVLDHINLNGNVDPSMKILLDWMYASNFILGKNSLELNAVTIEKLMELEPKSELLSLPKSPISKVFLFFVIGKIFTDQNTSSMKRCMIPNQFLEAGPLKLYEYYISLGLLVSFTNNNTYVQGLIDHLCKRFRVNFRVFDGDKKLPTVGINDKGYKNFLNHFIGLSLSKLDLITDLDELVGLSQIIRFRGLRDDSQFSKMHFNGVLILVMMLFEKKQYAEVYCLFEELTASEKEKIKDKNKDKLLVLSNYCYRMEQWFSGNSKVPKFKAAEEKLLQQLESKSFDFGDFEVNVLVDIAKQLAKKYNETQDKQTEQQCIKYYLLIKPYLKAKKRDIGDEFKTKIKMEIEPKKKKVKAPKPVVIDEVMSPIEEPENQTLIEKQSVIELSPVATNVNSFFTPSIQEPTGTDLFILPEQIPEALWSLIKVLEEKFPHIKLRLTGGAVSDLLLGNKPRDWDIAVHDNVSIYHLQELLKEHQSIFCQLRSSRYPILYCELPNGISIDFMSKGDVGNMFQADFNLAGFYCDLNHEKKMEVRSHDDSGLKAFHEKMISGLQGSGESLFTQDPVRIFRLAKYLMKCPKFRLDSTLEKTLGLLRDKWFKVFDSYLRKNEHNLSRVDGAIRDIFERFSIQEINEAFLKLGVLHLFSNRAIKDVGPLMNMLSDDLYEKNRLISWVIACARREGPRYLFNNPFLSLISWSPFESSCMNYAQGQLKVSPSHFYSKDVIQLVESTIQDQTKQSLTLK